MNGWDTEPLDPSERETLERHIDDLVRDAGVKWKQEPIHWLESEGDLGARSFKSPPVRSEMDYWAARHELGHLELNLPSRDADGAALFENEVVVWEWTIESAVIAPSEEARVTISAWWLWSIDEDGKAPEHLVRRLDEFLESR